ncbi:hypothetical protein BCR44DRAFT_1439284 [Catenaria anguillulae PL171]|uniref:Uncharacterized protein n=1 Tax=Catenaria anguillulae PL171 TaxID=765915 RepID=A0A1Y2HIV5_9FUNG|nr:hypothetical protein BCR44DRAFT_1439284 [Catenaria anguillulae PL171]
MCGHSRRHLDCRWQCVNNQTKLVLGWRDRDCVVDEDYTYSYCHWIWRNHGATALVPAGLESICSRFDTHSLRDLGSWVLSHALDHWQRVSFHSLRSLAGCRLSHLQRHVYFFASSRPR